jgi:hypothetical protein
MSRTGKLSTLMVVLTEYVTHIRFENIHSKNSQKHTLRAFTDANFAKTSE